MEISNPVKAHMVLKKLKLDRSLQGYNIIRLS